MEIKLLLREGFGGNDVGSVMLEENVVRAAGVTNCMKEEESAASFAMRVFVRRSGIRCIGVS
jgi:2-iminoacetate synthase ThiH